MDKLIKDLENSVEDLHNNLKSTPDEDSCRINTIWALITKTEYIIRRLKKI